MSVCITRIVHRAGLSLGLPRVFCEAPRTLIPVNRACTYLEFGDGRVGIIFTERAIDCMSCLVEETRRRWQPET